MEKQLALEFCKAWLAAWSGNQPENLIHFYSDDAFYLDPARPEGIEGKNNLLLYLRKLLANYPNWIWQVEEIFPYENGFILKWRAKVTNHTEAKEFFGLDIVEIENNKIVRNEVYFDPRSLISGTT